MRKAQEVMENNSASQSCVFTMLGFSCFDFFSVNFLAVYSVTHAKEALYCFALI